MKFIFVSMVMAAFCSTTIAFGNSDLVREVALTNWDSRLGNLFGYPHTPNSKRYCTVQMNYSSAEKAFSLQISKYWTFGGKEPSTLDFFSAATFNLSRTQLVRDGLLRSEGPVYEDNLEVSYNPETLIIHSVKVGNEHTCVLNPR